MGIPLTIQAQDNLVIEHLKKDLGLRKKIDVIRAGLALLEKDVQRLKKVKRWMRAAKLVQKNSQEINQEFQKHSRMNKL